MLKHPTPGPTRRCHDRSNLARGCRREHWHFFGLPTLRSPDTKRTERCGAEWRPLQNWWDESEERHALNSHLPARPPLCIASDISGVRINPQSSRQQTQADSRNKDKAKTQTRATRRSISSLDRLRCSYPFNSRTPYISQQSRSTS